MKHTPIAAVLIAGGFLWVAGPVLTASPQQPRQDQGAVTGAQADRDTTQKIRKAIIGNKDLSTYAHNVKILVHEGKVTLRGPVRSDDEKRTIIDMATAVAGAGNVTDEMTVEPPK